jgi:hypothetical protein
LRFSQFPIDCDLRNAQGKANLMKTESISILLGVAFLAPIALAAGFVAACAVAGVAFVNMPALALVALHSL